MFSEAKNNNSHNNNNDADDDDDDDEWGKMAWLLSTIINFFSISHGLSLSPALIKDWKEDFTSLRSTVS